MTTPEQQQQGRIALSLAEHVVRNSRTGHRTIGERLREIATNQQRPGQRGGEGKLAYRMLSTSSGSQGGYLRDVQNLAVADLVRDGHFLGEAGVQYVTGLVGDVTIPAVRQGITGHWLDTNSGAAIIPSDPTLGQVSMTPHAATAYTQYTRQLALQADALESTLNITLREAVTSILEQAVLNGVGGVQPLGLAGTTGVNAQSGTSLAYAGLRAMRKNALLAGAAERRLLWIGDPATQELLSGRERSSNSGRYLWDDDGILGKPAIATAYASPGTLAVGDWSRCLIGIWGDIELTYDPFANFAKALEAARLVMYCDVAFPQAGVFSVATGVN